MNMSTKRNPASNLKTAREYSKRCLEIVEGLLDVEVNTDDRPIADFLDNCRYITRRHYDDICEERSLCDRCGYPLCPNLLSTSSGPAGRLKSKGGAKQIFKIDTKRNQVYRTQDIEYFCSDSCLVASNYLRQQISEEPIYLRTTDTIIALKDLHLFDKSLSEKNPDVANNLRPKPVDMSATAAATVKPQFKDSIAYPYVTENFLDQLKDQMKGLSITEKLIIDRRTSESSSDESHQNSDNNSEDNGEED